MKVFLIRHTEYENPNNINPGTLPFPLSKKGRKHAKRIGEWFKKQRIRGIPIYSSPVKRAVETGEIIGKAISSSVVLDENLTERRSIVHGKPFLAPDEMIKQNSNENNAEQSPSMIKRL